MISHKHRCVFTHVPKTAGKSILNAFSLPILAKDYHDRISYIEQPYGHVPLRRIQKNIVDSYFKFAFVRNPWDRVVSAFFYLNGGGCNSTDEKYRDQYLAKYHGDFSEFIEHLESHIDAPHFRSQVYWLCHTSGTILADFVGRYESISVDYEYVAQKLSLPSALPMLNGSEHLQYREHFNDRTRKKVEKVYLRDIEIFGYEF